MIWTTILLSMIGAVVFLLVYRPDRARREVMSYERIRCPVRRRPTEVAFLREVGPLRAPGRRLNVLACSAFSPPEAIDCKKTCLSSCWEPHSALR